MILKNSKNLIVLLVAFISVIGLTSAVADDKYTVDVKGSSISWVGHKFFGGQHTGTINIKEGTLSVKDGKVNGGQFAVDMNSILVTDLQGETAQKLAAHLKTADFFDADNHPTALFVITKVEYANENRAAIVGDLNIRGKSQQIAFLAEIKVDGDRISATAKDVKIDRTQHDATYGSVKFFSDLGRKIVSDEFTLTIELTATK